MKVSFGWKVVAALGLFFGARRLLARHEESNSSVTQSGGVSWYGPGYHGKLTASGEVFDQNAMTAAHKKLKFGTRVEVTDHDTGRTVVVRINDRGPHVDGRILDLSKEAARQLGIIEKGVARNASIRVL